MNRLTEKDDQGNWHLKGVRWEQLNDGQVITGELREKLYGALWKLMEYEDTGADPEEVEELLNFEKTDSYRLLEKLNAEERKNHWISVEEQLPEDDVLVLVTVSGIYNALTFANAIQIGVYDRDGWSIEGYEDWNNPNVTAWMPLPEPYIPALEQDKPSGWQEQKHCWKSTESCIKRDRKNLTLLRRDKKMDKKDILGKLGIIAAAAWLILFILAFSMDRSSRMGDVLILSAFAGVLPMIFFTIGD